MAASRWPARRRRAGAATCPLLLEAMVWVLACCWVISRWVKNDSSTGAMTVISPPGFLGCLAASRRPGRAARGWRAGTRTSRPGRGGPARWTVTARGRRAAAGEWTGGWGAAGGPPAGGGGGRGGGGGGAGGGGGGGGARAGPLTPG